jgi:hypothetical protein
MQQIAGAFSRVRARNVKYVQVSWDQFEKKMGRELTVMYHWFEEKGFHFNIEEVRHEYPVTHTFDRGWRRTGTRLPMWRVRPSAFRPWPSPRRTG